MRRKKSDSASADGKPKKRWSAADKLRIVLTASEPGVGIADLCRREGISPAQYYTWKRELLGAAERIFEKKASKPSAREERLKSELTRAKDVIAEITSENLELKKTFSD